MSHNVYEKGISLTKQAMQAVESRLERNPLLPTRALAVGLQADEAEQVFGTHVDPAPGKKAGAVIQPDLGMVF